MLRACVLDFGGSWKKFLPYAEFAYNNSYQARIGMAPFEAMHDQKCRTPICWDDTTDVATTEELARQSREIVQTVKQRMQAAQDRQKTQADRHRREVSLEVGQKVLLKVSPTKGNTRIGRRKKLNPRYIGPFTIIEKINPVAYRLDLPPSLTSIHDVFHVSQLKPFIEGDS